MGVPRYFIYQHPTRANYEQSPYYWWWEYLRRVDDYGTKHPLYRDFGRLGNDFFSWWKRCGAELFAEQPASALKLAEKRNDKPPTDCLVVHVPALHPSMSMEQLVKQFRKVVRPYLAGGRSTARFPLYTQPDVEALQATLMVYDTRKDRPDLALFEIGELLHAEGKVVFARKQRIKKSDTPAVIRDKKKVMASTVSRYLRHAKKYIRLVPVDNSLIFINFMNRLRAKRTDSLTNRFFLLSIRPV